MDDQLRILHVLRAPVGGLFRHVRDVAKVQRSHGHEVGVICDTLAANSHTDAAIAELDASCSLGVHRLAMPRLPGPGDLKTLYAVKQIIKSLSPNILHGHGAKGGFYARLGAGNSAKAVYTPHGGALHYNWRSPAGAAYLSAERMLLRRTSGLSFVCQFERNAFEQKIGLGRVPVAVIHNGLWEEEFKPSEPGETATDLLFIGELRFLKGVDVLINAVADIAPDTDVTLTIVGDGPDRTEFEDLCQRRSVADRVTFAGALPAREAFGLGKILIIPSRAESFPYIVLEAIAAHKPMVATAVGGIPEILEPGSLVQPDDVGQLKSAILTGLARESQLKQAALDAANAARTRLNAYTMGLKITEFYQDILI